METIHRAMRQIENRTPLRQDLQISERPSRSGAAYFILEKDPLPKKYFKLSSKQSELIARGLFIIGYLYKSEFRLSPYKQIASHH